QRPQPTFYQALTSITIDYIIDSPGLNPHMSTPKVSYIHQRWSDHCLVTVCL
ncbi:hypothetical protein CLU79DRAFT_691094, partial [Phycomyces nitens]